MARVADDQKQKLDELGVAFESTFYDEENVLSRLHAYAGRHKAQFTSPVSSR